MVRKRIALTLPVILAVAGLAMSGTANAGGPKNCPPGLAKKNNGCLPPGQAKKRYQVGQPVPADVEIVFVPRGDLPEPREGYVYGRVDGDLLLIAEATRRVIEAVVAVDAASRAVND